MWQAPAATVQRSSQDKPRFLARFESTPMLKRGMRLIENLQPADLTPLEEAESYQQRLAAAIEEGKPLTAAELGHEIGKNERYVRFLCF